MQYGVSKKGPTNSIIFALVAVIGIGFLFIGYQTDTLGKFSYFQSQKQSVSTSVISVEADSYGGLCAPNANNGESRTIVAERDSAGCRSGAMGGDKQAYLKFDSSAISKSFTKATLFLKVSDSNQRGKFEIYSINLPWKEMEVRWNGPSNGVYWYGTGLGTKDLSSFSTIFNVNGVGDYVTVDVTNHVRAWIDGYQNYGLVIKAVEGSLAFLSDESGEPAFILVK